MKSEDKVLLTQLLAEPASSVKMPQIGRRRGQFKAVYQPLDQQEFKRRMGESFPAVYLTVISIVQGVALGILAQNTFGKISTTTSVSLSFILSLLPYAVLSFMVIVTVSFEYNWFVGIYRWSPRLWDSFIPLLLGLSQIGPLYFLNSPRVWWILNAVFAVIGTIAFNNTRMNQRKDMFSDQKVYNETQEGVFLDILIAFITAPVLFLLACIMTGYPSSTIGIL